MGEEQVYTDEERVILGEIEAPAVEQTPEEPAEPTEPEETEPEEQEEPAEPEETEKQEEIEEVEPEEPRIPQSQYNKIYGKAKDLERKHELLRTNPEEYYRQYPSERPQAVKTVHTTSKLPDEYRELKVEGGKYDGLILETVYKVDPAAAISLLNHVDPIKAMDLYYEMREEQRSAEANKRASLEANQKEIDTFSGELAKEMFQADFEKLSVEQRADIEKEIESIINFMQTTRRGGGVLKDAYYLMNRDKELANATKKGADGIVKTLTKDRPKSVSSGKSGGVKSVYDDFLSSTPEQLAAKIDRMSDSEYKTFIKGAPAELKDKFPGIIWE